MIEDFTGMMQAHLYRKIGLGIVKYNKGFIRTPNTSPPPLQSHLNLISHGGLYQSRSQYFDLHQLCFRIDRGLRLGFVFGFSPSLLFLIPLLFRRRRGILFSFLNHLEHLFGQVDLHKSFSSIFVSNIPWNASVQDLWDICNKWGVVIDVYIAAKRSKSGHRFGFVRFINVNDINQLVSNLRTTWMGGFHLFADVAKYGRTYNRPVERSGDGKPVCPGQQISDMSGLNTGTSNAGAESVGVSDCNKVYKEAGNEAVMSISVDDCIDLDGMERSILAKVKDLSVISELLKHMSSEGFDDDFKGAFKRDILEFKDVFFTILVLMKDVLDRPGGSAAIWAYGLRESLHRVIESFIVSYRNRTYRIIATEFAYWAPNIESIEDLHGKGILKSDAGEILGVHSQGDCGNVTTDDNEDRYAEAILLHNALSRQTKDAG
ncbi:nucleotide-binding alpha-beta plait domain-containing protein [Tanacetum coccineum]|uniref:Nucleotide-binding alpha-beta plait domain-containing protein n=1 Tax=Tanacetum coccineum TaxID=301880 RepID=A0ABQ5FLZ5_9ASTR